MAADEFHDLVDLRGFEVVALLDLVEIICCETFALRLKFEMKLEGLRGGCGLEPCRVGGDEPDAAAVIDREDFLEVMVEGFDQWR